MSYTVRAMRHGRVYEAKCEGQTSAIVMFEALADAGYAVELWQGSTKVR